MIRSRHRTKLRSVSLKRQDGTQGGEYTFDFHGRRYSLPGRWLADPVSPDGWRWIATPHSNAIIRGLVAQIADRHCELKLGKDCWGWTPVDSGHPHHVVTSRMGSAFRDDRLFRNGDRIRIWVCPSCHRKRHGDVQWSTKKTA
jgi:hypothetical protein